MTKRATQRAPQPIPEATPTPKRREDLRIQGATPEALTKALFGGATKRPETRRALKTVSTA